MDKKYFKVNTKDNKCYRVRADEHYNGVFANHHEWELYYCDEYATFRSWTFLAKCKEQNQIGEAIRLNINGVKQIDPI